jgi:hypothetical protein
MIQSYIILFNERLLMKNYLPNGSIIEQTGSRI